jgi:hypothetical protein
VYISHIHRQEEGLITDFEEQVPKEAIQPHPQHKYPKIVQVISKLPSVIKSPSDLQTCKSRPASSLQGFKLIRSALCPAIGSCIIRPDCPGC